MPLDEPEAVATIRPHTDEGVSYALREHGWQPQSTLEHGLTQTIEWIEAHLDQYRVGTYAV